MKKGDIPGGCFVEHRPIPGCSLYLLGSDRTVWTCSAPGSHSRGPWRARKLIYQNGQAPWVMLQTDDGRTVNRSVARLMAEVFPPVDYDEEDLPGPWASYGEEHGRAVLTWDQVEEMRRLKSDGWKDSDLAARYGVSRSTVYSALHGRTWAHEPPDLPDPDPLRADPAPIIPRESRRGRGGRRPRLGALRERPEDWIPLEKLEMPAMPRREARPVEQRPLDRDEARRLNSEGWSIRDLVGRYGVRPHIIAAILKGEAPPAADAAR